MKNGRFEPKDKSFSKGDKEKSEAGNCSYSSFVTLIFRSKWPGNPKVTLMTLLLLLCRAPRGTLMKSTVSYTLPLSVFTTKPTPTSCLMTIELKWRRD